jgi:tRNA G18 (ribose-2'-O)-methylase SpoU
LGDAGPRMTGAVQEADESDFEAFSSLRRMGVPDGSFIGDGFKVVRRMLESPLVIERMLLTGEWYASLEASILARPEADLRVRVASSGRLQEIVGFDLHQGVMAMARRPAPAKLDALLAAKPAALLLALDRLADAENVGAIIRTCAALGADGVIVGPGTCSPWIRRAVRTSMGAVLSMPIVESSDLARTAAETRSVAWYAAHIHGEHRRITEVDLRGASCLVLGGEAHGVSAPVLAACRATVYIPMAGAWDCLNVAAAAAVLLYEAARQRMSQA